MKRLLTFALTLALSAAALVAPSPRAQNVVNPHRFGGSLAGLPPDPDCLSGGYLPNSIICDDFNRANVSDPIGTSSSGHLWTSHVGAWGVVSNQGGPTNSTANAVTTLADTGETDVAVEATIADWCTGNDGFALRHVDSNNYLYVICSGGALVTGRRDGGSNANQTSAGSSAADGDVIKVVADGPFLSTYRNGTYIHSSSNGGSTCCSTGTRHGLRQGTGSATPMRVDNLSVAARPFTRYVPSVAGYTLLLDAASPPGYEDNEDFSAWANRGSVVDVLDEISGDIAKYRTNQVNTLPAVEFDVTRQDKLQSSAAMGIAAGTFSGSAYTVFIVVRPDNTGDAEASSRYYRSPPLLGFNAISNVSLTIGLSNQKFTVHHNALSGNSGSTTGASFLQSANYTVGQWYILEARYSGNLMTLRTNCTTTVTNASGTNMAATGGFAVIGQGSNGFLDAAVALELVYATDIGSTDADTICNELKTRFAL